MGINGLLPLLKSIQKPCSLKKFEGKTLGVDAYGWLHRGTVGCAMELAKGQPTRKFVDFAMHRVRMLQHFGVIPYLVFDGDYLPSKAVTEADRAKRREDSKKAGFELMKAGKPSQAYLEFQKSIDVTPEMARQLIDELKANQVQYVVAPYEADAQMVYLERKGIIHGILSEDSDLLVFGAKCLLTKLDQYGNCIEINKADFCACKEITLTGWSDKEFRQMAILSGCDYLASIGGMGLKTAYRMVRKHKTVEKVLRMLQFDGKFHVPKGYQDAFYQAELTFLHQRVFCPIAQALVLHTQPEQPIDDSKMLWIGRYVEAPIAQGVAKGDLHPMTKENIVPKVDMVKQKSTNMAKVTPLASRTPQQILAASGSLKKGTGKPISDFFPRRRPLAELDPNCLRTPNSTHPDLPAVSLPRVYLRPQPSPSVSHSAPARVPTRQTFSIYTSTTNQEPGPQKRSRLCADIESGGSPSKKANLSRSRFFASEASPTLGRSAKDKRARKANVDIFSDDSIEEAMLGLPDVDSFESELNTAKKVIVFQGEGLMTEKQTSASGGGISQSQDSVPGLTTSDSFTSSAEAPSTPTSQDNDIFGSAQSIKDNFTFRTTLKPNASVQSTASSLSSISSKSSKIPLAVKPKVVMSKAPMHAKRANTTPLQRIGASAANKTKLLQMTPPETPVYQIKNSKPQRRSLLGLGGVPFPEVAPVATPATTPSCATDKTGIANPLLQTGSEDLIIPDSEDDEPLSPTNAANDENISTTHLNLNRFVYNS
ncbi:hypothetical protein HYALB_00000347 [Hymenoscyphus albidus]|uniref:Exonuclease 1 n=1 Tax=Hymenoscyphus albidus TaxID=595503 RepID=A0A9N9LNK7_9HELO|nr:hypothetical protein HYALB_00000347 [Hymenoscyphus albidus]